MSAFDGQDAVGDADGLGGGGAYRKTRPKPSVDAMDRERRERVPRESALGEGAGDEGRDFVDGRILRPHRLAHNANAEENPIRGRCHLPPRNRVPQFSGILFSPHDMRIPSLRTIVSAPFAAGLLVGIITTAGAATMLGSDIFPDVPRGSYYDSAVGDMYDAGVIKGNPDGTFNPGGFVTRADVAVMLQRLRDDMTGNVRSSGSRSSSSKSSSSSSSSDSSVNPKGTIRFTTSELRVPENVATKKITVAVVRTGGSQGEVTVQYATSDDTATQGDDYTATSGTLTFESGQTSKTFDVAIKDDSNGEGDEKVTLTLSSPGGGASLGTPSTATLIITDNETGSSSSSSKSSSSSSSGPTVGLSATQYAVNENGGSLTITVVRGGSSSSAATVAYATSNGTGQSGNDYTSVSGTLSFGANESSKTFTVSIADNSSADGNKTFNVTLSSPSGMTLASGQNTATVTINDNESVSFGSGSFKFSKSTYEVTESSGEAVVTVQRTGGTQGTISVNYSTTSLGASAGTDYTAVSGTLTFAPGEAAKLIRVPIIKDDIADTGESFSVELLSPSTGGSLIDPYVTTVTID